MDFNGVADRMPHHIPNPYINLELASYIGPELLEQIESSLGCDIDSEAGKITLDAHIRSNFGIIGAGYGC